MRLAAALLLLAGCLAAAPDASAVKVSVKAEVAPATWKTIRLRGLPSGSSLAVRADTSGPINLLFVHESQLARFPQRVRPAFAASVERRLSFRVTLPAAGTYHVILDNRKGTEPRSIRLLIEALRPAAPPKPAPKPDRKLQDA